MRKLLLVIVVLSMLLTYFVVSPKHVESQYYYMEMSEYVDYNMINLKGM